MPDYLRFREVIANATEGVALFVSGALLLVGAQIVGDCCATQISGDQTPRNMVLARWGFFVNGHHFWSFSSKNGADFQIDPFNIPSSPEKHFR